MPRGPDDRSPRALAVLVGIWRTTRLLSRHCDILARSFAGQGSECLRNVEADRKIRLNTMKPNRFVAYSLTKCLAVGAIGAACNYEKLSRISGNDASIDVDGEPNVDG